MFKKSNKLLALVLAIALVVTTFGSDFSGAIAYAVEEGEAYENALSTWDEIKEEVEAPADEGSQENGEAQEPAAEEGQSDESSEDAGNDENPEETPAQPEEGAVDEPAQEASVDTPAENASTEDAGEASSEAAADASKENAGEASSEDASEASSEASSEAASEASSDDAASEASSEEAAENTGLVTVTYKVADGEGGSLSIESETVDLEDEEQSFEGCTATADDGYDFVKWVTEDGSLVTESETVVPSDIEEDTTYIAVFEEEVKMPAVSFNEHANGLNIIIDAPEGAFPEGTKVEITPVYDEAVVEAAEEVIDGEAKTAIAVDISFKYKDEEIEPLIPISVKMFSDVIETADNTHVVHISDDGEANLVGGVKVDDDSLDFVSGDFSIYIIVVEGKDARLEVKFVNGTTEVASMFVKQRDVENNKLDQVLYDPGTGDLDDGVIFKGWTRDPEYTKDTQGLTIKEVRDDVADNLLPPQNDGDSVTYYAMLFKQYTVTYLDDDLVSLGGVSVLYRADAQGDELNTEYTVNMAYNPVDDEHDFQGWFLYDPDKYKENIVSRNGVPYDYSSEDVFKNTTDVLVIKGDVVFSVNSPLGHWLIFDENGKGATYAAPRFILAGKPAERSRPDTDMTRKGYTFGGWYTGKPSEYGGTPTGEFFDFDKENYLTTKTYLYAKWIPNATAPYTVLIWKQNATRTGYDFAASEVGVGPVNASIKGIAIEEKTIDDMKYVVIGGQKIGGIENAKGADADSPFLGFTESSIEDAKITPEGDAVANVYFDRMQYTLKMYVTHEYTQNNRKRYQGAHYAGDGAYDATWNINLQGITEVKKTTPTTNDNGYYYYSITAYYGDSIVGVWPTYDDVVPKGSTFVSWLLMKNAKAHVGDDHGQNTVKGDINIMDEQVLGKLTSKAGNYVVARYDTDPYEWTYNIYFADVKGNYPESPSKKITAWSNQNGENSQHAPAIEGYKHVKTDGWDYDEDGHSCTINFYYQPLHFPINYMDGAYLDGDLKVIQYKSENQLTIEEDIAYGADISGYNKKDIPCPEKGFVFAGWYLDKACTTGNEFEFDTTMPIGGITVFAKWIQVQYRVFLHPQALLDDNKTNDPSLKWGEGSKLCFRVSYNGKISSPEGTRTNYVFVGWYRDPDCTPSQLFDCDAFALNEGIVTEDYDKHTHMTDDMDPWGEGATKNTDLEVTTGENPHPERFWITKELNLYGKWRKVLDGASGIYVKYDLTDPDIDGNNTPGTGTGTAKDTNLYIENATVSAAPAVTAPEGYQFDTWVIRKFDKTKNEFVDTEKTVMPGGTFNVREADAQVVVDPEGDGKTKIYTVYLRAEYKPIEDPTPTYIPWFNNDGTAAFHIDTVLGSGESTLGINEAVTIQAPKPREGFEFKGWAKIKMGMSESQANAFMSGENNSYWQVIKPEDMFLYYKDGKYYPNDSYKATEEAEKVAADEMTPYEALFAVWEELPQHTVTYEITGDIPEGKKAPEDNNTYLKDADVTVLGIGTYPEGYEFKGWTTKDVEPEGKEYAEGDTFKMPDKNVVLHGEFSFKKYEVTFEFDGTQPEGFMDAPDAIKDVAYKSDVDVSTQTKTVTDAAEAVGYIFLGWSTKDVTLANDKFEMPAKNVKLIGSFRKSNKIKYTVEHYYEGDDGQFPATADATDTYNDGTTGETFTQDQINGMVKAKEGYQYDQGKNKYFDGTGEITAPTVKGDGTLVIKLYYVRQEFTVIYKYAEPIPPGVSELPKDKDYKFGAEVKIADDASATGYEFVKWELDDTTIAVTNKTFKMPAKNVVITGYFRKLTYKVSYEYDSTKPSADITEPSDETGLNYQDPVSTAEETTFVQDQKDKFQGYTFLGWKVKEGLTQTDYVTTFTMPANDVVLVGSFVANEDVEYKVEYYFEKETEGEFEHNADYDATKGDGTTGKALTEAQLETLKTTFAGYDYSKMDYAVKDGMTISTPIVQGDGSLVVRLYYVRKKFKVTYVYIGTVPDNATSLPKEESYRFGTKVDLAKDAEAEGYTFSGWSGNYKEEVSGSLIDKVLSIITGESKKYFEMPAADVIIQGSFEANKHEVSYKIVSSEVPSDITIPETKSYAYKTDVYVEAELSAKGYAFAGWISKTVTPESGKFEMPDEDVEFIGVFDPITYEITFEYRVAAGTTPPSNLAALQTAAKLYNGTFKAGEDIPLPTRPNISGYVFSAWKMEKVENEEGNTPFDRALKRAKDLLALKVSAADGTMKCEEYDAVIYSVISASSTPTPPPNPDPPTPTPTPGPTPDPTPVPTPVTVVPGGQAVLGARRETGNGQAVLGARRGRTDDETNTSARAFAIIVSAAVAISLFFVGKKKEEEEEG